MQKRHVPDLEHCQELDRLCKENNITLPETEFYWVEATISGEWYLASNADNHYSPATKGFFPAPLVSEQGEWLKDYMEDKENDGKAVPDDMPKADRMGLLWEPNFMQKILNYLIAEGIITTL